MWNKLHLPQVICTVSAFHRIKCYKTSGQPTADAQRYRVGVNHQQIPVNKPRCPVMSNHRDGQSRVDDNYGSRPHYEPNSFSQWQEQPDYAEPPLKIDGYAAHYDFREDDSDYF